MKSGPAHLPLPMWGRHHSHNSRCARIGAWNLKLALYYKHSVPLVLFFHRLWAHTSTQPLRKRHERGLLSKCRVVTNVHRFRHGDDLVLRVISNHNRDCLYAHTGNSRGRTSNRSEAKTR